jgi:hypothetical protein
MQKLYQNCLSVLPKILYNLKSEISAKIIFLKKLI